MIDETTMPPGYMPCEGQAVPLLVVGLTDDLERALDAAGLGWIDCEDSAEAAEWVDEIPGAVLGYGPGVFGRALSRSGIRVEAATHDVPVRSVILLDRRPDELPTGEVDDDERRLAFRARIPLRVSAFVLLNDPGQTDALRHAVCHPDG